MRREDKNLVIENQEIYQHYKRMLINMALAQFEWHGLPDTCYRLELERKLLFNGTACLCTPEGLDNEWLSLGYRTQGRLNIYGLPSKIVAYGLNSENVYPSKWEILFDNMTQASLMPSIDLYAKLLWECHCTFRSNLMQQNTPYIVATTKNESLSFKNIFNHIFGFDPVITVKNSLDIESTVKVLDLKKEYLGPELLDSLKFIWNQALAVLGITGETTKKERMLADELVLNRQEGAILMSARLLQRTEFCNMMNDKYGLNLSVNLVDVDTTFIPPGESNDMMTEEGDI